MRIYCVARYRSATLQVDTGGVLDVSEAEARRLMADAPGCWALDRPEPETEPEIDADRQQLIAEAAQKAIDTPPHDKMIRHRRIK